MNQIAREEERRCTRRTRDLPAAGVLVWCSPWSCARSERRGGGGRVPGRELPGRPAELQHAGVQRLRDPRDEDQARLQPRGSRAARPDHRQRRGPRARRRAARWRWSRSTRPAGTRFTSFRWAGTVRRRDCRYALQLYADAPDIKPIALKNVRANQRCPRARARPGRRLPIAHLQRQRRDAHRPARHLRRRRRPQVVLGARRRTTSAPTRPRSGSPTRSPRPSGSSATPRWRAASG